MSNFFNNLFGWGSGSNPTRAQRILSRNTDLFNNANSEVKTGVETAAKNGNVSAVRDYVKQAEQAAKNVGGQADQNKNGVQVKNKLLHSITGDIYSQLTYEDQKLIKHNTNWNAFASDMSNAALKSTFLGISGNNVIDNMSASDRTKNAYKSQNVAQSAVAGMASLPIPGARAVSVGLGIAGAAGSAAMNAKNKDLLAFEQNKAISSSSGYGGLSKQQQDFATDVQAYEDAGLVGKLTMNTKEMKEEQKKIEQQQRMATGIINEQNKIKESAAASSQLGEIGKTNKYAGYTGRSMQIGKNGLSVSKKFNPEKLLGGKNIIASGHLHAHKNNLNKLPKYKLIEFTSKGMPVVTKEKAGELMQHIEIETGEWILNFKATQRILELMEDGSDEAKIEAGKIVVTQLLKNTKDNEECLLDDK